jgi:hypothetical protein
LPARKLGLLGPEGVKWMSQILKDEKRTDKKKLACQKTTPAKSERIAESFVTWTAFEKSATKERKMLNVWVRQ